ncbi:MAG: hypothetical protein J07AB43_02180, partial [Candidatus Nanosalina sp. J07AB43]
LEMSDYNPKDFETLYDKGAVVREESYHQPGRDYECGCINITDKGAYRITVIDYNSNRHFYLHQNLIAIRYNNTEFKLRHADHKTKLTKRTLNKILPSTVDVFQLDKQWYVEVNGERKEFENGVRIDLKTETTS